jgi:hypothetical protein
MTIGSLAFSFGITRGLDPRVHCTDGDMDARIEPGHDDPFDNCHLSIDCH